jgi:HK97 family phage major capsid protein
MENRSIKGLQFRTLTLDRSSLNRETRTVRVAISSEMPVERWFGIETLGHNPGEVDMSRIQNGAAALLSHDTDQHIGVLENVTLDPDKVIRADVRFSRSQVGEDVMNDVEDWIRTKMSVGYQINDYQVTKGVGSAPDQIRVTDWTPMEASFVAIPADDRVGVGRSFEPNPPAPEASAAGGSTNGQQAISERASVMETTPTPVAQAVNTDEIRANAMNEALELQGAGARLGLEKEVREALGRGLSGDAIRKLITDKLVERSANPFAAPVAAVQLTDKEQRSYSIARAIMAQATNTACFEREVSQEIQKTLGREAKGIYVPTNLGMKRALDATVTATAAGLISQEPVTFIEFLYAALALRKAGATFLPGCVGNIPFARQITTPGAQWTGDDPVAPGVTNGDPTIQVFTMTPKQLMAQRSYSKQLLAQTAGFADTYVMQDLAQAHALAVDLAGMFGLGSSNQPMGLANATGLTIVPFGTNGAAPTFANMVAMETAVALGNVDTTDAAYLTNTKVRGCLKQTLVAAAAGSRMVWETAPGSKGVGEVNGYPAQVTNQVPYNLTKGTGTGLSAILYGVWRELIIAEWGALDVLTDPYTLAAQGLIRVISTQLVDVNYRHIQSFAASLDAIC